MIVVENLQSGHWPAVAEIFREGIATGQATFETRVPAWAEWDAGHLKSCRLVALWGGEVGGWAALSPASRRPVYRGVAEVSVYVAAAARGRGVGRALLDALIAASEAAGLWTLQAVMFPENAASVTLHSRCGFRLVGRRERLAQLNGAWRDVVLFERRSAIFAAP